MVRILQEHNKEHQRANDEHFKIKWGTLKNISSDIIKQDDEHHNMVRNLKEQGKEQNNRVRNIKKHGEEP